MSKASEELLRSVDAAGSKAARIEWTLAAKTDFDLFCALGQRLSDTSMKSIIANLDTPIDVDSLTRSSAFEEVGRRVFYRWSLALHDFVCTPGGDEQELRDKVFRALSGKDGGSMALVAGVLVAVFGASPAIAAIVATLLVRLLVTPAVDELCRYWAEALKAPR